MKKIAGVMCVCALAATSAFAALTAKEQRRVDNAAGVVRELRGMPDNGIPEGLWNKAQCVAVIPSMKKAAFVVGGEYGKGVMSCRRGADWSAPVFLQLTKGSWGLQIGAEEADLVLLVMNQRGVDKLMKDKVSLGADASVAAGPVGRDTQAATDAQMSAEILSYSRAQGVFAGIDLSGGVLEPDRMADLNAYGRDVNPRAILTGTHAVPAAARVFVRSLGAGARATSGQVIKKKK